MIKPGLLSMASLICVTSGWAQGVQPASPTPYNKAFGREYAVVTPEFTYPQEVSSFAGINYKNCVLHTFDLKGKHWTCGRLHDGYWVGIKKRGPLMQKIT